MADLARLTPPADAPEAAPAAAMTAEGLHVPFRSASFLSRLDFEEYLKDAQPRLDARYVYERSLASSGESIVRDGTCACCLRPARFTASTAGGDALPDGRLVPNWREELVCDCADRLNNRLRALLHFLESVAGLRWWSRVLLFGPPTAADRRIAAAAAEIRRIARLGVALAGAGAGGYRLAAEDARFHLAVTADTLHRVPPLAEALAELRRVLVPGGRLVFTVPFHWRNPATLSRLERLPRRGGRLPGEAAGDTHDIGWDILDRLRAAGFAEARAHTYWSEELGYLGPVNMIFSAIA